MSLKSDPLKTHTNSIYPLDTQDFDSLELAVNKLTLNDASVSVQVGTSNPNSHTLKGHAFTSVGQRASNV